MQPEERDRLIIEHLPVVYTVAKQLCHCCRRLAVLDLDDMVQIGTLGLMDAIERYQPDGGASLATYCRYRIRGTILDALRSAYSVTATVHEPIEEKEPLESEAAERIYSGVLISQMLHLVNRRQAAVLEGLLDGKQSPEIADRLSLTKNNVCQIKFQAIRQIRRKLKRAA